MQVLVLSDDVPEPATHGGRLAIRNELEAIRRAGHDVRLIAYHRGELAPATMEANRALASSFDAIARPSLISSTLRRPWQPYQVSSRRLRSLDAMGDGLSPEVIICHHDWSLPAAFGASAALGGVPVILRSHNDELKYYRDAARHARGASGLYLRAEYARLRLFLARVPTDRVAEVWFMSAGDVTRPWSEVPHRIIPPVMFTEAVPVPERYLPTPEQPTLVFVGALDIPHTLAGLNWFLDQVWPLVLAAAPGADLLVAGRRPGPTLARRLGSTRRARLMANPESLEPIFGAARAFINPIFAGSGVNLKLGQPIGRALPVVTTSVGLRGLDGLRDDLSVADTPEEFARACVTLLTDDKEWRSAVRAVAEAAQSYSAAAIGAQIDEAIREVVTTVPLESARRARRRA